MPSKNSKFAWISSQYTTVSFLTCPYIESIFDDSLGSPHWLTRMDRLRISIPIIQDIAKHHSPTSDRCHPQSVMITTTTPQRRRKMRTPTLLHSIEINKNRYNSSLDKCRLDW